AEERLVVKRPPKYQYTASLARPIGRIAPRSFPETESARAPGSAALSQSKNAVPRNRAGEAPGPLIPINCAAGSCTPAALRLMPVWAGQRPDRIVECPGAVSVTAWSW